MNLPIANAKYQKLGRFLSAVLGCMALGIWFFHFHVWYQYDATRPTKPDFVAGRVYPQNSHGHVVYLTADENARMTRLRVIAFSLFGAAFLASVLLAERIVWKRPQVPWKKRTW